MNTVKCKLNINSFGTLKACVALALFQALAIDTIIAEGIDSFFHGNYVLLRWLILT